MGKFKPTFWGMARYNWQLRRGYKQLLKDYFTVAFWREIFEPLFWFVVSVAVTPLGFLPLIVTTPVWLVAKWRWKRLSKAERLELSERLWPANLSLHNRGDLDED